MAPTQPVSLGNPNPTSPRFRPALGALLAAPCPPDAPPRSSRFSRSRRSDSSRSGPGANRAGACTGSGRRRFLGTYPLIRETAKNANDRLTKRNKERRDIAGTVSSRSRI